MLVHIIAQLEHIIVKLFIVNNNAVYAMFAIFVHLSLVHVQYDCADTQLFISEKKSV